MILATIALVIASAVMPDHPRLIATAQDFAELNGRLESCELGMLCRDRLYREVQAMFGFSPPEYNKDKSGVRILHVSRSALSVIAKSAMAYRFSGERRYATLAIGEAMSVCAFPDWNPAHFLDTAEMTLGVALCYDWLYDVLSDRERDTLADSILHKGLVKADGSLCEGWWLSGENNWCQVCNGGMVAGAIAIAERNPGLARKIIDRAVKSLSQAMAKYAPDGGFPEGPSAYWPYAMQYNAIAIAAIEKFDGTDHGLGSLPGFAAEVDYLDSCTGPTGLPFNFSDAGTLSSSTRSVEFAQWWMAARYGRTDTLVFHELPALRQYLNSPVPVAREDRSYSRFYPFLLLNFQNPVRGVEVKTPKCRIIDGENPIAVMRTSWTDRDAWYAGLKGGVPGISHGHMDVGSFVLDAEGVRWVLDIGNDNYSQVEASPIGRSLWDRAQDSPRWSLFRLSTEGHGTLQFNDEQQRVSATACFSSMNGQEVTLDLSATYGRNVKRTFVMGKSSGFTVRDVISGARSGERVIWRINTLAEVQSEGACAKLRDVDKLGNVRTLSIEAVPSDIVFEVLDCSRRRKPYEMDNPGLKQLVFSKIVPASGSLHFEVRFSR